MSEDLSTPRHWVLLRGLAREARHWGPLPELLSQAWPGVPVHTPDLPGNGRRCRETSPRSVHEMVEAVREDLHSRGVPAPHALLGMSLGAMVALEWARRYPDEVQAAALINTSVRPFSPPHQRLLPRNLPALLRGLLDPANAEAWERTILQCTTRQWPMHASATQALLRDWVRWHREQPVTVGNTLRQLTAAARFRAASRPPPMPLLLLVGEGDQFVSPHCSQALARAWGLPIRHHPRAGHDLSVDDPEWVVRQVFDWWTDRAPERGLHRP
jgi:pimeloyl-ACP methyl ester carboxylesterase